MIKLSIQAEGQPPVERVFEGTVVNIGRHESNEVALAMHGVSARHCRLVQIGETYEVEDLGSMNGTYVNRVRVRGRQAITPADEVVVATFVIRLVQSSAAPQLGVGGGSTGGKTLATQIMQVRPHELEAAMRQAGRAGTPTMARPPTISPFGDNAPFVPTSAADEYRPAGNPSYGQPSVFTPPTVAPSGQTYQPPSAGYGTQTQQATPGYGPSAAAYPGTSPMGGGPIGGYSHAAHGGGVSNPMMGAAGSFAAAPVPGASPYANPGSANVGGAPAGGTYSPPTPAGNVWAGGQDPGLSPRQESLLGERDPAATQRDPLAARLFDLIDPMAQAWEQQGKPASMLLGGDDLRDAKVWLTRGVGPYPRPAALHRDYVLASSKLATRQRIKLLMWPVAALVVLGTAVVVAKLLLGPEPQATPEPIDASPKPKAEVTLEERSNAVAALADGLVTEKPDLALLLATEGLHVAQRASVTGISRAEQVLRKVLAQTQGQAHWGHEGAVTALVYTPDGRRLITGGADGVVRIWEEAATGMARVLTGHSEGITALTVSKDGRWLFSASEDRSVRRWDLTAKDPTATVLSLRGHKNRITKLALSPDSAWLASAGADPEVRIWDLRQSDPNVGVVEWTGHQGAVTALTVVADGAALASGGVDRQVRITAIKGGKPQGATVVLDGKQGSIVGLTTASAAKHVLSLAADGVGALHRWGKRPTDFGPPIALPGLRNSGVVLAESQDGKVAALAGDDKKIAVFASGSGDPGTSAQGFTHPGRNITALALSANGDALAAGDENGLIAVWALVGNTAAGEPMVLRGHSGMVRALSFSPDGQKLASASDDRSARVWDFRTTRGGMAAVVGRAHAERVGAIALNHEGTRLVSGGADGVLQLWSIDANAHMVPLRRLSGPKGRVSGLALGHGDRWLVAASQDGVLRLWDLENGSEKPAEIRQHNAEIYTLGISADERWLVSGGQDNEVYVWPFAPEGVGKAQRLAGHSEPVLTLGFSGDGKWVASAGQDKMVNLWDVSPGLDKAKGRRLRGHESTVWSVAISPDGQFLASGGDDRNIHLRRLADPSAAPVILRGHQGSLRTLAFSPQAKWLASGADDKSIRLWDLASEHPDEGSKVFEGLEGSVSALLFDPKLPRLYSTTNDGTVRIWDLSRKVDNPDVAILAGHTNVISMLRGDVKGAFVVTAGWDKTVRLWPTDAKWLTALACRTVGRSMTQEEWQKHLPFFQYRATCSGVE